MALAITAPEARPFTGPLAWFRRWMQRRELRRFMREEEARLGSAGQALSFALDVIRDHYDRIEFLNAWRAGDDLSDWPEYSPNPKEVRR